MANSLLATNFQDASQRDASSGRSLPPSTLHFHSFQSLRPSRGLWTPLWLRSCVPCRPSSFTLLPHQRSPVLLGSSDSVFLLYQVWCPPSPSLNSSPALQAVTTCSTMQPNSLPSMSHPTAGNRGKESQRHHEKGSHLLAGAALVSPLGQWNFKSP